MKQYQVGCAIVRIHGKPEPDKLKAASEVFMKKVWKFQKERLKELQKKQSGLQEKSCTV